MPNGMLIEVTVDINDRWEKGIAHDPRSVELMNFISEYDYMFCNDYFRWKTGGDGDNGETLMYEIDEYFAARDRRDACQQ